MKAISTVLCLLAFPALAQEALPGWAIHSTAKSYQALVADTKAAVKDNGLIVVTQAGPTKAAAARGIIIPGNLVIGAFNNDYAVRVLETSVNAMIEAPIRFYVTENADGTATLSYKTPSHVFAPYAQQGGEPLQEIAAELDKKFQAVAESAVN